MFQNTIRQNQHDKLLPAALLTGARAYTGSHLYWAKFTGTQNRFPIIHALPKSCRSFFFTSFQPPPWRSTTVLKVSPVCTKASVRLPISLWTMAYKWTMMVNVTFDDLPANNFSIMRNMQWIAGPVTNKPVIPKVNERLFSLHFTIRRKHSTMNPWDYVSSDIWSLL